MLCARGRWFDFDALRRLLLLEQIFAGLSFSLTLCVVAFSPRQQNDEVPTSSTSGGALLLHREDQQHQQVVHALFHYYFILGWQWLCPRIGFDIRNIGAFLPIDRANSEDPTRYWKFPAACSNFAYFLHFMPLP